LRIVEGYVFYPSTDADGQDVAGAGGVGGNFGLLFDIAELFVNYTPSPGTMLQLLNYHFQFL
jgi:hypothetical protein